jgi:hypothetical protein
MLTTRIDELAERAAGGKPACVANAVYRVYEQR